MTPITEEPRGVSREEAGAGPEPAAAAHADAAARTDSPQDRTVRAPEWQHDIVRYFEVAGPDYAAWSPSFNMHFGYYERGMNPFRREPMLERTNRLVLEELRLPQDGAVSIGDFGCGLGATARYLAARLPHAAVTGFTIVPWQVHNGNRMSAEAAFDARVRLVEADFTRTPLAAASLDGAYALESGCYATGSDKADLLAEIARAVKPGGRVVVVDGFRKDSRRLWQPLAWIYRTACRSWALREMADIDAFTATLAAQGFVDVERREISWRVAPSFAHVPFLIVKFAVQRLLAGDLGWKLERWHNLMGPFFGALLGLARRRFGYYVVTGKRR